MRLPLESAKCLKCRMHRLSEATGRSHRAAPLALLAKCSRLYLLCPCQPARHGDCFDKKAQHGLMCLFQSYCQCKHRLPLKHTWRKSKETGVLIRRSTASFFCVKMCWIHFTCQSRLSLTELQRYIRNLMFCLRTLQKREQITGGTVKARHWTSVL